MFGNQCVVSIRKSFRKTLDSLSVSTSPGPSMLQETVFMSASVKLRFGLAEQKFIPECFY